MVEEEKKIGLSFDETENAGTWFVHEDGWKVCLRTCPLVELDRIRKLTTKKRVEYRTVDRIPHRFAWEDVDADQQSKLLWEYCIVGWENIFDKKTGSALELTSENKWKLMNSSVAFSRFVADSMNKLNKLEEEVAGEQEKNF